MKVNLDISLNLLDQFEDQFNLKKEGEVWPMNPEIGVLSTVTITYESPARKERMEIEKLKAAKESDDD